MSRACKSFLSLYSYTGFLRYTDGVNNNSNVYTPSVSLRETIIKTFNTTSNRDQGIGRTPTFSVFTYITKDEVKIMKMTSTDYKRPRSPTLSCRPFFTLYLGLRTNDF